MSDELQTLKAYIPEHLKQEVLAIHRQRRLREMERDLGGGISSSSPTSEATHGYYSSPFGHSGFPHGGGGGGGQFYASQWGLSPAAGAAEGEGGSPPTYVNPNDSHSYTHLLHGNNGHGHGRRQLTIGDVGGLARSASASEVGLLGRAAMAAGGLPEGVYAHPTEQQHQQLSSQQHLPTYAYLLQQQQYHQQLQNQNRRVDGPLSPTLLVASASLGPHHTGTLPFPQNNSAFGSVHPQRQTSQLTQTVLPPQLQPAGALLPISLSDDEGGGGRRGHLSSQRRQKLSRIAGSASRRALVADHTGGDGMADVSYSFGTFGREAGGALEDSAFVDAPPSQRGGGGKQRGAAACVLQAPLPSSADEEMVPMGVGATPSGLLALTAASSSRQMVITASAFAASAGGRMGGGRPPQAHLPGPIGTPVVLGGEGEGAEERVAGAASGARAVFGGKRSGSGSGRGFSLGAGFTSAGPASGATGALHSATATPAHGPSGGGTSGDYSPSFCDASATPFGSSAAVGSANPPPLGRGNRMRAQPDPSYTSDGQAPNNGTSLLLRGTARDQALPAAYGNGHSMRQQQQQQLLYLSSFDEKSLSALPPLAAAAPPPPSQQTQDQQQKCAGVDDSTASGSTVHITVFNNTALCDGDDDGRTNRNGPPASPFCDPNAIRSVGRSSRANATEEVEAPDRGQETSGIVINNDINDT